MRNRVLYFDVGLALWMTGCGGDVTIGTGGAGGTGGTGGAGGTGGTAATGTSTTGSTATGTVTMNDDFAACSGPGQCVLAIPDCCGGCGVPEVGNFVAVNSAKLEAYSKSVCPEPEPCPDCPYGLNPHLFAYCDAGTCVAADVRTHAVSACTTSNDCQLRNGTSCCEGCGVASVYDLTAVASGANPSLVELVCVPEGGCPPCLPEYPPEASSVCGANGHCEIIVLEGGP